MLTIDAVVRDAADRLLAAADGLCAAVAQLRCASSHALRWCVDLLGGNEPEDRRGHEERLRELLDEIRVESRAIDARLQVRLTQSAGAVTAALEKSVAAVVAETARVSEAMEERVGGVAETLQRQLADAVHEVHGTTSELGAQVAAAMAQAARMEERAAATITEATLLASEGREQLATAVGALRVSEATLAEQIAAVVAETARVSEAVGQLKTPVARVGKSAHGMRRREESSPPAEASFLASDTAWDERPTPDASNGGEWETSKRPSPAVPDVTGLRKLIQRHAQLLETLAVLISSALLSWRIGLRLFR